MNLIVKLMQDVNKHFFKPVKNLYYEIIFTNKLYIKKYNNTLKNIEVDYHRWYFLCLLYL